MNVRTPFLWMVALAAASPVSVCAQGRAIDHKSLQASLTLPMSREDATSLAERLRSWFGAEAIAKGPNPKVDGLNVAWALEVPGADRVSIATKDGKYAFAMRRLPGTGLFAAAVELPNGAGMVWNYRVDGKALGGGNLEVYRVDPDTLEQEGTPKGTLTQKERWKSRVFDGTDRDWWVYVPAQYSAQTPACVMVFQDGGGAKNYIPTTFDNLIAKGQMPVTVAVFVNPGTFAGGRSNRSVEYDTLSDKYASFIMDEILPEVEKNVKLRHDAQSRAIAGVSSGAICAFTVAYERPTEFSKVLSWVGSFTNIQHGADFKRGGHNYAGMVRKGPVKPIRIYMQDGSNDLDNDNGSWPLANLTLANSFEFRKWDYKFVYGEGFHSDRHGRAVLGDALRWLWRDYKP